MRSFLLSLLLLSSYAVSSTITLQFYQTPLPLVLQALANHRQLNLVLDEEISAEITLSLKSVQWERALDIILTRHQLAYLLDDNILFIHKRESRSETLERFIIPINHSDLSELNEILNQQRGALLSQQAQIITDVKNSRLIIQERAENIPSIRAFIQQWDTRKPQVKISAHIVTINSDTLKQLGVKWQLSPGENNHLGVSHLNINYPTALLGVNLARINSQLLGLELSALQAENRLEIIANPNLLTTHLQTASIKQGAEIPYEVSNGNNRGSSIEFKDAVLGLEVMPKVLNSQNLELTLHITQNTPGRVIRGGDGSEHLAIDTQEIKTQVIVKSGETIMLGGILQKNHSQSNQKVPLLGDIPLLGGLFKSSVDKNQQRELVIFITPEIL